VEVGLRSPGGAAFSSGPNSNRKGKRVPSDDPTDNPTKVERLSALERGVTSARRQRATGGAP